MNDFIKTAFRTAMERRVGKPREMTDFPHDTDDMSKRERFHRNTALAHAEASEHFDNEGNAEARDLHDKAFEAHRLAHEALHFRDDKAGYKHLANAAEHASREANFFVKEAVEIQEAVSVDKKNYDWGKMITVRYGSSHSFPLHPKHQEKIKNLKDGESTTFKDETGARVSAYREGDKIRLKLPGVNKETTVTYSHFTEAVEQLGEETMPYNIASALQNRHYGAAEYHKKKGNMKGYAAHFKVADSIEDAMIRAGSHMPIRSTRISKASEKAFAEHPHVRSASDTKSIDESYGNDINRVIGRIVDNYSHKQTGTTYNRSAPDTSKFIAPAYGMVQHLKNVQIARPHPFKPHHFDHFIKIGANVDRETSDNIKSDLHDYLMDTGYSSVDYKGNPTQELGKYSKDYIRLIDKEGNPYTLKTVDGTAWGGIGIEKSEK